MTQEDKIQKTIERSKEVIKDVSVINGGIVAANTDQPYYPRHAKNYHYVWPRDAAYICVAADMIGLDITNPFLAWLESRPEDFVKEGLLFERYATNGRKEGSGQFQPDQAGTILWAIYEHLKDERDKCREHEVLIRRLADGLVSEWKGKYFFKNTVDLWEEGARRTSTKMENNFTYSLAACGRGLMLADQLINNPSWAKASSQMLELVGQAYSKERQYFLRNHGRIDDFNVDASLLGLVYPFEAVEANDERMINTVKMMEEKIVENGGVHRFEMDYYDGEGSGHEGGGAWPILNFWMAIYYATKGDRNKSEEYYFWVLDKIDDDGFIPEQIFEDFREGIKPLAWSHAMFIVASKHLGFLKS
ncbi:hypothetical protein KKC60_05435 [Patescibacteria group bacterium]|nr:hypothetical protein [Patescibacteria group bacterium]